MDTLANLIPSLSTNDKKSRQDGKESSIMPVSQEIVKQATATETASTASAATAATTLVPSILKIAIDFGGVLSKHDDLYSKQESVVSFDNQMKNFKTDTKEKVSGKQTQEHRNMTIDIPNALEILNMWKDKGHKLYLVSFCGKKRAVGTRESIMKTCPGLFEELYFVKDIKGKPVICNHIGAHLLIDDTELVHQEMKKSAPHVDLYLFDGTIPNDASSGWRGVDKYLTSRITYYHQSVIKPIPINNLKKFCYL
jgi:hypothetical protein